MPTVNNDFYTDLGDRWFEGDDHAIALLRAESRIKIQYTREVLAQEGLRPGAAILDVACGGGLVSFPLAQDGFVVKGVDLAAGAIEAARARIPDGQALTFEVGDAYATGEPDGRYDAVLLLDMLEHVDRPGVVIQEAARVVRPGGLVVFHTFNRTPASWALAIHGMKVVARDTPEHVHVYHLFVTPDELTGYAEGAGLSVREIQGIRPVADRAFWWSVFHRRIHPDFAFAYTGSKAVGYAGYAVKA